MDREEEEVPRGISQQSSKVKPVGRSIQDLNKKPTQPKESKKVPTKPAMRREYKGRYDSTLQEFNDDKVETENGKISKLTFWYDDKNIYGLKAFYTLANGNDVAGEEHLSVRDKSQLKASAIEIENDDHIAHITGKYKDFVEYIKIVTAKGVIHEFGNQNESEAQEFMFEMESDEHPILVFGALDTLSKLIHELTVLMITLF